MPKQKSAAQAPKRQSPNRRPIKQSNNKYAIMRGMRKNTKNIAVSALAIACAMAASLSVLSANSSFSVPKNFTTTSRQGVKGHVSKGQNLITYTETYTVADPFNLGLVVPCLHSFRGGSIVRVDGGDAAKTGLCASAQSPTNLGKS